jgi:putative peptidoglycan lipid II flippase
MPIMLLLSIYADEVTQLAFGRGRCDEACVQETAGPLTFYALALWPAFLSLLVNRTLSAANRQAAILWTTAATVALTIVLDVILLGPMEQSGLALASTIGVYANVAMLLALLRHHFPAVSLPALGRRQARMLIAAGVAAGVALLLDLVLPTDDRGSLEVAALLVVKVAIALVAFGVAARALAGPELAEGLRAVRPLLHRRRRAAGA